MGEEGGGERARKGSTIDARCYSVDVLGIRLYIGCAAFNGGPDELALLSRRAEERGVVLVGLPHPKRPCEVLQAYLYALEYTRSGKRRLARPSLLTAGILLGTLQARRIADMISQESGGKLSVYVVSYNKETCSMFIAELARLAGMRLETLEVAKLACKREDLHSITRNYLVLAR